MLGYNDAQYSDTPIINNHSVTALILLIILGDDYAKSLQTPPNNHIIPAPIDHTLLGYDSLQRQHKIITHRLGQKLPPP